MNCKEEEEKEKGEEDELGQEVDFDYMSMMKRNILIPCQSAL